MFNTKESTEQVFKQIINIVEDMKNNPKPKQKTKFVVFGKTPDGNQDAKWAKYNEKWANSTLGDDFEVCRMRMCKNCSKVELKGGKLLRCFACKSTHYCSKKCQKEDWNLHKEHCKRVRKGIKMGLM